MGIYKIFRIFIIAAFAWIFLLQSPDGVKFGFGPFATERECLEALAQAHEVIGEKKGWQTTGCVLEKGLPQV